MQRMPLFVQLFFTVYSVVSMVMIVSRLTKLKNSIVQSSYTGYISCWNERLGIVNTDFINCIIYNLSFIMFPTQFAGEIKHSHKTFTHKSF